MKLSTRLLVLLLPTMTIVMVGYLYWSMAERENTLVSQAEQEMGACGAALAVALRYAFNSNTHADFQGVINDVTRDPKIYAILVYDEGGNPLLVSDSVATPSLAPPASLARVLATGKPVSFRRELEDRDVFSVLRRSEEHTSELQSLAYLVCRLLLEKKKKKKDKIRRDVSRSSDTLVVYCTSP